MNEPVYLKPGIYPHLTFSDYRNLVDEQGDPLVNFTSLKYQQQSWKHFFASWHGKLKFTSDAARLGRAEHSVICEEADGDIVVSQPCAGVKRNGELCGKTARYQTGAEWFCGVHKPDDAFEPGDYVSRAEYNEIIEKRESLRQHPCISALRRSDWAELTLIWEYEGVRFKGRLDKADLETPDRQLILDLKRMGEKPIGLRNCNDVILRRQYHVQAALYRSAVWELKKIDVPFLWIFVEANYPYDVLPIELRHHDDRKGLRKIEDFIRDFKKCKAAGKWPGVWEASQPALSELPEWA